MSRLSDAWRRREAFRFFKPDFVPTPPVRDNWEPCCESYPSDTRHLSEQEQDACFERQRAHLTDAAWCDFLAWEILDAPWGD